MVPAPESASLLHITPHGSSRLNSSQAVLRCSRVVRVLVGVTFELNLQSLNIVTKRCSRYVSIFIEDVENSQLPG